jgi:hypothetical protein
VVFHAPWYNSNRGHYKEADRMRKALERTLFDAGVDLVLNGHVHAYERTHPVYDNAVNQCGPVHIVVGDGGNYEGPYGNSWIEPQPAFSKFREGSFGAGSLVIHNATHATWEWRRTTCVANTTSDNSYFEKHGDPRNCHTVPDVSEQAMRPVDMAILHRDANACPNKRVGSAAKVPFRAVSHDARSSTAALYATILALVLLWLITVGALIHTAQTLRRIKARIHRSSFLLASEDEFDTEFGEASFTLKDLSSSR